MPEEDLSRMKIDKSFQSLRTPRSRKLYYGIVLVAADFNCGLKP